MTKGSARLPVINTPINTVPIEMYHYCPAHSRFRGGDGSQRAITLCLHRHFNLPAYSEGKGFTCGSCAAITHHMEVYGLRHQRRVPVMETRHKLLFTDERTGKQIETTTREWRKVERLNSTWFTKRVDGELHVLDLYTARNLNIDGSWPKTEPVVSKIAARYADDYVDNALRVGPPKRNGTNGVSASNGKKVEPPKKGLDDLSAGKLISSTFKGAVDKRRWHQELRKRHVEKYSGKTQRANR